MADTEIQIPETLTEDHTDIVAAAATFTVTVPADLETASFLIAGGNELLKEIDAIFEDPTRKAFAAHKSIKGKWNEMRNPVDAAVKAFKREVGGYHNKLRLKEEAERREAEAKKRKEEEDRRLAAAAALEDAGHNEVAEEMIETPAPVRKPMISTPPPPKVKGITTTVKYTADVVSFPEFVAWVMVHAEWDLLSVNQSKLNALAKSKKGEFEVGGCELVTDTQVGAGRRS